MNLFSPFLWLIMVLFIGIFFGLGFLLRDFFQQLIEMSLHAEFDDE